MLKKFWGWVNEKSRMVTIIIGTVTIIPMVVQAIADELAPWLGVVVRVALFGGAIVAGVFGHWIICGWLALNALAKFEEVD